MTATRDAYVPRGKQITPEEIAYLCEDASEYYRTPIVPDDVVATFANGMRHEDFQAQPDEIEQSAIARSGQAGLSNRQGFLLMAEMVERIGPYNCSHRANQRVLTDLASYSILQFLDTEIDLPGIALHEL